MTADTKKKFQLFLVAAVMIAALRTAYIFYERKQEAAQEAKQKEAPPLDPDLYVVPKKLYPYDLKSAKEFTKQPVWIKVGYSIAYYPFDEGRQKTNFAHEVGMFGPIEKVSIVNVVRDAMPSFPEEGQVMAVFRKDGKAYAFPIASIKESNYRFYADKLFFIQDPHELYKHWSPDIWQAVDNHEVKPGMNQLQADFAIGLGIPEGSGDANNRTVKYPNGGKPLVITYRNGKAVEIKQDNGAP